VFTLASLGCALSQTIGQLVFFRALQGMSAGAGMVVSRAIIRDMFPPADAQRVMSQVTIYFGIAPAVAPMIGGFLYAHTDWHAIFWLLVLLGAVLLGEMPSHGFLVGGVMVLSGIGLVSAHGLLGEWLAARTAAPALAGPGKRMSESDKP